MQTLVDTLQSLQGLLQSQGALILSAGSVVFGLAALYRYRARPFHAWRSNKVPADEVKKLEFVPDKKQFYFGLASDEKPMAKMVYNKRDFGDYLLMACTAWISSVLSYGLDHTYSKVVLVSSLFLVITFALRHGAEVRDAPLLVRNPVKCIYNLFAYKIANMRLAYFAQISLCLAEAAFFSSGIIQRLPVYDMLNQMILKIGEDKLITLFWCLTFGSFHLHLGVLGVFRVLTFLAHLWDHEHVFTFLSGTGWKKVLNFLPAISSSGKSKIESCLDHFVGLSHAFVTGVFTHIVTVIPWYCYLRLVEFSARSSANEAAVDPVLCLLLTFSWLVRGPFIEQKIVQDFEDNELNDWYIRDHWLGHHDRFEFNYMHGPHHDALPVGMIAVADNGPVEGLVRHFLGHFDCFKCPPHAFYAWTKTVIRDVVGHQYVPGVFPWSFSVVDVGVHHIEHHFLSMHPLGNGIESDPDPRNNCEVETWLSGDRYSANNKVWNWFVGEVAKFEENMLGKEKALKYIEKSKADAPVKKEE